MPLILDPTVTATATATAPSLESTSNIINMAGKLSSNKAFQKSLDIIDVLERYRLPVPSNMRDRSDEGLLKWLATIHRCVKAEEPIRLILPAFPFKSPNRIDKVLGALPDKGEELALAHLNGICDAVGDIYPPGARLVIASDGLVYNDLLGVPDAEVWAYGQALRAMTKSNHFSHIRFIRLRDLLGETEVTKEEEEEEEEEEEVIDEATYVLNAPGLREQLVATHTPSDYSAKAAIAADDDVCATYRGYIKFLAKDLAHSHTHDEQQRVLSKSQRKRRHEVLAKKMIARGKAFAAAIEHRYSDHMRLSIHPSTGATKLTVRLSPPSSPSDTSLPPTPWHSSLLVRVDGSTQASHKQTHLAAGDSKVEVVMRDGHGWMLRERSPLFEDWNMAAVDFEPLYPCGLRITPKPDSAAISLAQVDMAKVRALAELNSPVVLRGFQHTTDRELFVARAHDLGTVMPWKFGVVLEVRDRGADARGLNNVLSGEPMPMHYDGLFKLRPAPVSAPVSTPSSSITNTSTSTSSSASTSTSTSPTTSTSTDLISVPPNLQLFTAVTPSPPNSGYTLFASSRLLFQSLPAGLSLSALKQLTWSVRTSSFENAELQGLPLVVPHPVHGTPCLRFHEPWPSSRTRFEATDVELEAGADPRLTELLTTLLYDRRVCLRHSWEMGDVLVSDNVSMMHTRTAFTAGADRELWRIHVD